MNRVLRWLTGAHLADAIAGDLREQYRRRAARSRVYATAWLAIAVSGLTGYLLVRKLGDLTRTIASALGWRRGARDLVHALRGLRKAPWYAITAGSVVALAMTLAAVVFAVVDGVLFRPVPYPAPHELHVLGGDFTFEPPVPASGVRPISGRGFSVWSRAVPDVPMTAVVFRTVELSDGREVPAAYVDEHFFEVSGVAPLFGDFGPEDFHYDALGIDLSTRRVTPDRLVSAIISHSLWRDRFGEDPTVVGRTVEPYSEAGFRLFVVGVMPRGFVFPSLPSRSQPEILLPHGVRPTSRERFLTVLARIQAPMTAARIRERLAAASAAAADDVPGVPPGDWPEELRRLLGPYDEARVVPLRDLMTRDAKPAFLIVFVMVSGLTLLACVNLAGLGAARTHARASQFGVRIALGAGRSDVVRLLLFEAGLIVAAGAGAACLLARPALALALTELPSSIRLLKAPVIDWRVLAFIAAAGAVVAVAVAGWSFWLLNRGAGVDQLLDRRDRSAAAASPFGRALIIAGQTTLAFTLALGGVLLVSSLARVLSVETGLRAQDVARLRVRFASQVPPAEAVGLAQRVRALPGVASAGAVDQRILDGEPQPPSSFRPLGVPLPRGVPDVPAAMFEISAGFFRAAGLEGVEGRLPTDSELDSGAPFVVVSEALARAWWPGESAIGRTLESGTGRFLRSYTVIGTVRDARLDSPELPPTPAVYTSIVSGARMTRTWLFVAFERGRPDALAGLPHVFDGGSVNARVTEVRLVDELVDGTIRSRRFRTLLVSAFAVSAVLLLGVGSLGLAAMRAARRTREVGIRIALGARPSAVVGLIVRDEAKAFLVGLAGGVLLAAWLVGFLESWMFGATVYDPWAWSATGAVVIGVAGAGALIPALRASRVDPADVLRAV